MKETRKSECGLIIIVDWNKKKIIKNWLSKGTYWHTSYEDGTFAGWRSRKDIKSFYNTIIP